MGSHVNNSCSESKKSFIANLCLLGDTDFNGRNERKKDLVVVSKYERMAGLLLLSQMLSGSFDSLPTKVALMTKSNMLLSVFNTHRFTCVGPVLERRQGFLVFAFPANLRSDDHGNSCSDDFSPCPSSEVLASFERSSKQN